MGAPQLPQGQRSSPGPAGAYQTLALLGPHQGSLQSTSPGGKLIQLQIRNHKFLVRHPRWLPYPNQSLTKVAYYIAVISFPNLLILEANRYISRCVLLQPFTVTAPAYYYSIHLYNQTVIRQYLQLQNTLYICTDKATADGL